MVSGQFPTLLVVFVATVFSIRFNCISSSTFDAAFDGAREQLNVTVAAEVIVGQQNETHVVHFVGIVLFFIIVFVFGVFFQ